jgi:hypothetical protein
MSQTVKLNLVSFLVEGYVLDVLVFYCFHVEANGGNGGHDFTEFEFVKDGGLACGVEADHQDSHVFGSKVVEQRKEAAH